MRHYHITQTHFWTIDFKPELVNSFGCAYLNLCFYVARGCLLAERRNLHSHLSKNVCWVGLIEIELFRLLDSLQTKMFLPDLGSPRFLDWDIFFLGSFFLHFLFFNFSSTSSGFDYFLFYCPVCLAFFDWLSLNIFFCHIQNKYFLYDRFNIFFAQYQNGSDH